MNLSSILNIYVKCSWLSKWLSLFTLSSVAYMQVRYCEVALVLTSTQVISWSCLTHCFVSLPRALLSLKGNSKWLACFVCFYFYYVHLFHTIGYHTLTVALVNDRFEYRRDPEWINLTKKKSNSHIFSGPFIQKMKVKHMSG